MSLEKYNRFIGGDFMPENINGYTQTTLDTSFEIEKLITVHYFEYSKNYIFEGESHNFWEFLYVDKGEIVVMADKHKYILQKGQMIFHQPNEWHTVIANGKIAPNLIVIAFQINSKAMDYFCGKILNIDNKIKGYLATIIKEAKSAFSSKLEDPMLKVLQKRQSSALACEQMIRIHLELLLIELIRGMKEYETVAKTSTSIKEYNSEEKLQIIKNYLHDNIRNRLTLDNVSHDTLLSKSSLQKLFQDGMGTSVMDYFKEIKVAEAKTLIREGNHNFTEISAILGYQSIHYFSRMFKKHVDMTPSEYASSVKALLDK